MQWMTTPWLDEPTAWVHEPAIKLFMSAYQNWALAQTALKTTLDRFGVACEVITWDVIDI